MKKMQLAWNTRGWNDYLYWQQIDKKNLKKINRLIESSLRTPFDGIGKPEPLKHQLSGLWSRRITDEHRLVYEVLDDTIVIQQCRYHY